MICIIADDEYLVRFSILDMLNELNKKGFISIKSIRQASNGEELLRMMLEEQPNIVFLDIRMPGIDGLEVMEQGRRLSPDTFWVVLSGYTEFEYAKRAVTLGALDYLVKPASEEDIERVVHKAAKKIMAKRIRDQVSLERCLLGISHGTVSEEYDAFFTEKWVFTGELIIMDTHLLMKEEYILQHTVIHEIRSWLKDFSDPASVGGVSVLDDGNIVVVFAAKSPSAAEQGLSGIQVYLNKKFNVLDTLCTQLFSNGCNQSLSVLLKALQKLTKSSWLRLLYGLGGVVSSHEIEHLQQHITGDMRILLNFYRIISKSETDPAAVVSWFQNHHNECIEILKEPSVVRFLEIKSGLELCENPPDKIVTVCINWVKGYSNAEDIHIDSHGKKRLVSKALEILSQRYTEEVGLAQIADMLQVTPNYLSTVFRKGTGETFTRYLTHLRMEESVRLLRKKNFTIKEVSSQVGYGSSHHFNKVFKEWYGVNPTTYMMQKR